jgi:hypothetical protein
VLETTAANTEALRELKLVFMKYITKLKENSYGSPSVSKSAVDSDAGAQVQASERMAPSQVPCSKEATEDDAYNMDFVSNTDTLAEDKTPDAVPQETLKLMATRPLQPLFYLQFHRLRRRIRFGRIPNFHPKSQMLCTRMSTT